MRQWLRKTRLTFTGKTTGFVVNPGGLFDGGGNAIPQLRVFFSVNRSISGSPNTFSVRIWNLSKDHRNSVGKELDNVMIEAGYMPPEGGGNVGIIAKGQIRDVMHDRDGADIITTISCGDGDAAYRSATISKTIKKGTPVSEVVEELYKEMEKRGISRGEWKLPDGTPNLKRPYSMCGACSRELDTLGRSYGFYWSIQNETLEIIPGNGYLPGLIPVISPETGLVGTPTITDNGIRARALLNPEIRPNRQVKVISEMLEMNSQGDTYRVSQATYEGDNQQDDFIVEIHGESVSEGKVDEGVKP